ncbi:hypothetical protein IFM89_015681 [Coptis chinensis]|uniref:Uncharacterized protein n=1 Tax=Coptis chinensis TaxID=261450 RepID=A0A835IE91_9MAGN|nr:hypothetical protein IFM89_015681 [Coptis chinensis]
MDASRGIKSFSEIKRLKEFGWQIVLVLNLVLLSWIWKEPMEENEERCLCKSKCVLLQYICHIIFLFS